MRRIALNPHSREKLLHIEAPGCIINITIGLTDPNGHPVTPIDITADSERYSDGPSWYENGIKGALGRNVRIIQTTKTAPDAAEY